MKIDGVLYFSPHYRFKDLDFKEPIAIAKAFQDRVEGFYFEPSARLIEGKHAFAAGLVICAGIEFIAAAWAKQEPEDWLKNNLKAFSEDESLANTFWQNFRHGLAHEGRIKSFGQFSLDCPDTVVKLGEALIVNPHLLLRDAANAFRRHCAEISTNQSRVLSENLRRHFEPELKATLQGT